MGLLSRASTLDKIEETPGLAFSDFINKHSFKTCLLLKKEASNYIVKNSLGLDAYSILSATSTVDFWNGICKSQGKIYNFTGSEKTTLLQLFSFNLKDKLQDLSFYKNSNDEILLCEGKLSEEAAKDFENINDTEHTNDVYKLNPLLKKGSVVLMFNFDFSEAIKSIYKAEYKADILEFDFFLSSVMNEIYNRFACKYNISDTTIKYNLHVLRSVIFADKTYSLELIQHHIILNLKEVLDNFAEMIQVKFSGTAASCDQIESFLQAE